MTRPLRNRLGALFAALAFAGVAASLVAGQVREAEAAHRDQADVARMTTNMKSVCIGRFLIDLPQETRLELRGPRIDGFDISSFDEPEAAFYVRLAQREAELRATPDQFGGNKNLRSVREVKTDNGVIGKIFVHGHKVTEGTRNRGLELEHYRDEGVAIEAMVHGHGMSFAVAAGDYNPDNIEDLPRLVAKLVPNPRNQIPTEPGFCIDRAWFRDPLTADQGEEIMMSAQLPSHPDIEFLTILAAGNKPSRQSLLERSADTDARLTLAERWRISTLRAAPRQIAGITGDELVTRYAEMNDTVGYSFWWEVAGTVDNVLVPHFVFKMTTGEGDQEPVSTSMSEDAAMALWDKITSSIRFHTPVPAKRARPASPDNASAKSLRLPEA
ncbi:T6SS immunity protein Tli4 family protein [Massilia sp. CMS3.1]|uniref:T6SS immunity protein Tli4 family protein n=1 Tax=Massilia sp. CMS3.1 TaxID=3373083 RepID=UPI003EE71A92